MPQWAGSCWYYLRYLDPHNDEQAWDPEKEKYWMPVDFYIGGAEHAVLHLLYARFWHKVLYDCGLVSTKEPFQRLFNQGMILGFSYTKTNDDGDTEYVHVDHVEKRGEEFFDTRTGEKLEAQIEKMSKSRGNVVNPDDVVDEFGADTLRLYEMFMGPLEATKPWDPEGVSGVYRFLGRCWRLIVAQDDDGDDADTPWEPQLDDSISKEADLDRETERLMHQTIQKVTEDIEGLRFNTAISQLMVFVNHLTKKQNQGESVPWECAETLVLLLSPFAPHMGEELWRVLGHEDTNAYVDWPEFDEAKTVEETITIAVQVMGKTRGTIDIARDAGKDDVLAAAKQLDSVARHLEGKTIRKEIYVPGRIVNFVAN